MSKGNFFHIGEMRLGSGIAWVSIDSDGEIRYDALNDSRNRHQCADVPKVVGRLLEIGVKNLTIRNAN